MTPRQSWALGRGAEMEACTLLRGGGGTAQGKYMLSPHHSNCVVGRSCGSLWKRPLHWKEEKYHAITK